MVFIILKLENAVKPGNEAKLFGSCVLVLTLESSLCYPQVELDVSELNIITSASTLALAEHCNNLSV